MTLRLSRFIAASSLLGLIALAGASVTDDSRSLVDDPAAASEPVVQVWGARTLGIKGLFGVHTWIAVKPSGVPEYTVYEVIGWRLRWTDTALVARNRAPDRWFGSAGELYAEKRGAGVDELIKRIHKLAADYPYAKQYTLWPGPNSNTFVAYITRAIPELKADLPATAIGKDYLGGRVFSSAPSGSGFQFSLAGLLGMSASGVEGLELNILSLNFGVGPSGLKLPLLGRIGTPRIDTALALDAQASADFLHP
ncbi:MAG TPA: DUF3750 domain-containing protein [Burkholderiales bacterium]|jgi:hypothetical protein|nr:DUF3750 domain-containing protein [Burkholderiales bacterium]